jgi:hypothetical protein
MTGNVCCETDVICLQLKLRNKIHTTGYDATGLDST